MQLKPESHWLTTFNTLFGRRKFKNLPLEYNQLLWCLRGLDLNCFENQPSEGTADDILIFPDSEQVHVKKQVLQRSTKWM